MGEKMNQNIKELVKSHPDSDFGNMKLGEAIRELYYGEEHQNNVRNSWVCQICGENTYDVDIEYIGSNTNHLGCELKGGSGSKGWLGVEWPKD
tara:strand:- start:351 stop:629 length:279 start_codon:yes stop_codon:yes gene_type:complete